MEKQEAHQGNVPPIVIYTIREYRIDQNVTQEHIFIGNILDSDTIKALNSGRKDPNQKDIRPIFDQFNIQFDRQKSIQKYYPVLLNFNDSWNLFMYKIRDALKIDQFYIWSSEIDRILTHQFIYRNKVLYINPDPFQRQENLDRIFTAYGNLVIDNQIDYIVRHLLTPNQSVINLISRKTLDGLATSYINTKSDQDLKLIINRFLPIEIHIDEPFYNLDEINCLNDILRDSNLPVKNPNIFIHHFRIEQCTIHINKNADDPFINLETIFQLIPMENDLIFVKLQKGDRSISKVSKLVNKFKSQVSKDDLAEWANIDERTRGLLYRKLKHSPGLVIYKIYDNGSIDLQINWTHSHLCSPAHAPHKTSEKTVEKDKDKENKSELSQLHEIVNEVKELNEFLSQINKLNFQLPTFEKKLISHADPKFISNPLSKTHFTYFNFKTQFDTQKHQINWNAFNYLTDTFKNYFHSIPNWRIFNQKELRKEFSGLSEANLLYILTNNNLVPDKIHPILYSLGLIGNIDKEQTVTIDRQKDIIVEFKNTIYDGPTDAAILFDRGILEDKIREIKDHNPGVLINIKFDDTYYVIDVKGAKNLWEIKDINFAIKRLFEFYIHIGEVYKFIKNYNCSILKLILNSPTKIITDKKNPVSKTIASKISDIKNIFDIEDIEEDLPQKQFQPTSNNSDDEQQDDSELIISRDLVESDDELDVGSSKKIKSALDYLKEVSPIFKTEYRRHGCTTNLPIVINKSDFWHDFSRLQNRFMRFKDQLNSEDSAKYTKDFKKDIDSQVPDLEKFKKRVDFVAKRLSDSLAKSILNEISDIVDRYQKGALMKVPIDKKKINYSKEFFYVCPLRWCSFCRESRLIDEIDESGKNAICNICGNVLYSLPNPKNSFIGFPSSKKFPHINCLPCCFKNDGKFKKKISECNISHPTKTFQKVSEKSAPDTSHPLTGDVIPFNRYGHLDSEPTGKLNDFFNNGIILEKFKNNQSVFVRKGVNDVGDKDAFIEALSYYKNPQVDRSTPTEFREKLLSVITIDIFSSLNNGLISTIFKTSDNTIQEAFDDFKLYLSTEYINEDILWGLTPYPDLLTEDGYNLLIIKRSQSFDGREHKYTMLCPVGIRIEDYFNPKKVTGIILKLENNMYYPIVKIDCQVDVDDVLLCTRKPEEFFLFSNSKETVVGELLNYALEFCSSNVNEFEKDRLDLYQTIEELDKTSYLDREQLNLHINPYLQVVAIKLLINNDKKHPSYLILPIRQTPYPVSQLSELYHEFDDIQIDPYWPVEQEELPTFSEVFDIIKILAKKTKIPLKLNSIVKNHQNGIYGFKLTNGSIIIFREISESKFINLITKNKDINLEHTPIILEEDSNEIDLSINGQKNPEKDQRKDYVNKTTFQKESYQRLRFELSRIFFNDDSLRSQVIDILNNSSLNKDQKRLAIETFIKPILNKIAILDVPNLMNYQLPQIRTPCITNQSNNCLKNDSHCIYDKVSKTCKVLLPKDLILPNDTLKENTLERYIVLIADEILRNVIKRLELLDGKVSIYVNSSQMVYQTDKEILINDIDFKSKINDLYARSTDYLDLLRKHYYLEPSEVFTREVEQNLHYFEDDSWYKNTGLSRNDFIMNSKNIYDLLNSVLNDDLGELFWNFIDKHDWKLWLNAFREISPDEYQNIYQYSQFMEHIKYGRSSFTDVHISLLSRLHNLKVIIMNKNAIGSRKFHCLGTTQAQTTSKSYLIFYQVDDDRYLVGKTPHLDLTNENDVIYIFKEDKIPPKFFKIWHDQCRDDHKIQKKPDPADYLISSIQISPDIDSFIDDINEPQPDIRSEKIIKPPAPNITLKPMKKHLTDTHDSDPDDNGEYEYDDEEDEEDAKPPSITFKKKNLIPPKITIKKKTTKEEPKITFKKKSTTNIPPKITLKKKSVPPPKLTLKKKSYSNKKPPTITLKRKSSREVSRKRSTTRSRSKSLTMARKNTKQPIRARSISRESKKTKR